MTQTTLDWNMNQVIRMSELSIQENKGVPRIWLEGKYLEKAGFLQGCNIKVQFFDDNIKIALDQSGERRISGKKSTPVIDINNSKLLEIFNIADKVKVIIKLGEILVTRTKKAKRIATQLHDKSCGSIFSGGGLLDQSAKQAGFNTKWAIEVEPKYADVWQANHNGSMYNCDIASVDLEQLSQVELLIGGIPCEPFSTARRNGTDEIPEEHKNADLSMFFLMIVEQVNPRIIVLEEVPMYLKSGIGTATMAALRRMGYNVETRIVAGTDCGELTIRKRAIVVASMGKISFPDCIAIERTMAEILQLPEDPECEWFTRETKAHIFNGWDNQKAKGNNFQSQIITPESRYVQTIPKRYFAQQAGNPIVKHPTKQGMFRWLTLTEVKKIMGLPDSYDLGEYKTFAGEVMGQGVLVNLFHKIIQRVCA